MHTYSRPYCYLPLSGWALDNPYYIQLNTHLRPNEDLRIVAYLSEPVDAKIHQRLSNNQNRLNFSLLPLQPRQSTCRPGALKGIYYDYFSHVRTEGFPTRWTPSFSTLACVPLPSTPWRTNARDSGWFPSLHYITLEGVPSVTRISTTGQLIVVPYAKYSVVQSSSLFRPNGERRGYWMAE